MPVNSSSPWFENPLMGQKMRVLVSPYETGGRKLVLEYVTEPFAGKFGVPIHFHPNGKEIFEILSGKARYRLGEKEGELSAGQSVFMPAGVPHLHPWSDSDEPMVMRQTTVAEPADLDGLVASLQGAITIYGLARDGKVNKKGMPNPLQIGVIIAASLPATYVAGPPRWLQDLLMKSLGAIGRFLGYRNRYDRYGSVPLAGAARSVAA